MVGAAALFAASGGCAKVAGPGASGSGGRPGTGLIGPGPTGGTGLSGGTGNSTGTGARDGGIIAPDTGGSICQQGNYKYVPQIPTVFLVVDRSGSMFGCRTNGGAMMGPGGGLLGPECVNHADTAWYPMRDGVLMVLRSLEDKVRFGFAAFTGEQSDPVCPVLNPVLPSLNNANAIATNYNALGAPAKGETPTRKSLEQVAMLLKADTTPGAKYILFVTDGEPDYCNDGSDPVCAPDSVIGELQTLEAGGITTLIMGISTRLTTISDAVLQGFANAGAGQPVAPPYPAGQTLDLNAFWDRCNFIPGWKADFDLTGRTPGHQNNPAGPFATVGTYATAGGTAMVYKPDLTNQTALVTEITRALSGVKSCTFDLNDLQGQMLTVNLNLLDMVGVSIMGTSIALDTTGTNGWHMLSASVLELVGSACDTWRMPQNTDIRIDIPCGVIVIP